MKVRMLQSLSGPEYALRVGDEAEFDADEAKRLVEAGIAEPVAGEKKKPVSRESKVKSEIRSSE